jgi:hypothetical protein
MTPEDIRDIDDMLKNLHIKDAIPDDELDMILNNDGDEVESKNLHLYDDIAIEVIYLIFMRLEKEPYGQVSNHLMNNIIQEEFYKHFHVLYFLRALEKTMEGESITLADADLIKGFIRFARTETKGGLLNEAYWKAIQYSAPIPGYTHSYTYVNMAKALDMHMKNILDDLWTSPFDLSATASSHTKLPYVFLRRTRVRIKKENEKAINMMYPFTSQGILRSKIISLP